MRAWIAALLAVLATLGGAASAHAGDPIMPLSQVSRGMHCQARTVIRGTDVTTFDAEVLDVVGGANGAGGPMILVRVSGPAVDVTGAGEGFSGSPIYCPDAQGTLRNAGALALGVNDFGNKVLLATPIERILGEPVDPPTGLRAASRSLGRVRPLTEPLTFTGLTPALAGAVTAAGRRIGRPLLAAPTEPAQGFPQTPLVPGSAFGVDFASGDLGVGAIGTVSYTDGTTVWGFGHPFQGVGPRSLLLQDAFVYDVINNPIGGPGLTTYKLAAPGHDVGTLTNDTIDAVVGRSGALPPLIPLRVYAYDLDAHTRRVVTSSVVDESGVGEPLGSSALGLIGTLAIAQAGQEVLRGVPARSTATMCVRLSVRERRLPLGFCKRYIATTSPGSSDAGPLASLLAGPAPDFALAAGAVDAATFAPLHVTGADVSLRLRRGLREAALVDATGPARVRPGGLARVRLSVRLLRGPRRTLSFGLRVPRGTRRGLLPVILTGPPADAGGTDAIGALASILTVTLGPGGPDQPKAPASMAALAARIAGIAEYDGVRALFLTGTRRPKGSGRQAYRNPSLRLTGSAVLLLNVS
jgi:hypothetical protein